MTTTAQPAPVAMTGDTWRTVRHALAVALARGDVSQREYDAAMTEVMGTSDKARW